MPREKESAPGVEVGRATVKKDAPILSRTAQEAIFVFLAFAACYAAVAAMGALHMIGAI